MRSICHRPFLFDTFGLITTFPSDPAIPPITLIYSEGNHYSPYLAKPGPLNYELNPAVDYDWRGENKTLNDALDKAFSLTGNDRSQFEPTMWVKDVYGHEHVVEWKGPNYSEVNIDYTHDGYFDKTGKWIGGVDAPHVGYQYGKRSTKVVGHIVLDEVPAGRVRTK